MQITARVVTLAFGIVVVQVGLCSAQETRLKVGGLIETTSGGVKFPDGSIQSTAATEIGPAGGDLSGTFPSPSVVDDSHLHSAATVSGIATAVISPIDPIYVRGTGLQRPADAIVRVGGTEHTIFSSRGLALTVLERATHSLVSVTEYDTWAVAQDALDLADALDALDGTTIGILTSWDSWAPCCDPEARETLRASFQRVGLAQGEQALREGYFRTPYAAVFTPESAHVPGSAIESLQPADTFGPFAEIAGWLIDGTIEAPSPPFSLRNPLQPAASLGVDRLGRVWIGQGNTGANRLYVVGSSAGTTVGAHVAQIHNSNDSASSGNADVLALKIEAPVPGTANNFVSMYAANDVLVGQIEGNGLLGVSFTSSAGDYAEYLPRLDKGEGLSPGDVVGLHAQGVSRRTRSAERVMVVSEAPIVLGNDPGEDRRAAYERIAFVGQVEVRVRGAVRAGDLLLASGFEDGTAEALPADQVSASRLRQVLGRALEDAGDSGEGGGDRVLALVGLPDSALLAALLEARDRRVDRLEGLVERLGDLVGLRSEASSTLED
jgi:hypothetical protein